MIGLTGIRAVDGNRIALLKNGAEFFPALIAAIDGAESDVRIETYIFRDDRSGKAVAEALARAAQRGVAVRVMVDGVGSHETPVDFLDSLARAGVHLLVYRPERRRFHLSRMRLRRNHRKIALVDGQIGFVGGINIIDDLNGSLSPYPRYDYSVRIEGPVLASLYPVVHSTWRNVALRDWQIRDLHDPPIQVPATPAGEQRAEFVIRDNLRFRRSIEKHYREAIIAARERVLIVCPYFLPGRGFRRVLIKAARRGIRVTILLQGRADHPLLQLATRALYARLLSEGIVIAEYQRSMLHGKVATIDDRWATVGSSNLDPFSLFLNREANIVVWDAEFARTLRDSVEKEIESGALICERAAWERRPLWERVKCWLAFGIARWAAGLVGYSRYWQ
ncbi:MAG TPA: cardiolipin synthase ClsB [Usitatibacteraceae bacterium]|nr:cardiolipin synthase ClsB [Usitatibacteraceae bacterium]